MTQSIFHTKSSMSQSCSSPSCQSEVWSVHFKLLSLVHCRHILYFLWLPLQSCLQGGMGVCFCLPSQRSYLYHAVYSGWRWPCELCMLHSVHQAQTGSFCLFRVVAFAAFSSSCLLADLLRAECKHWFLGHVRSRRREREWRWWHGQNSTLPCGGGMGDWGGFVLLHFARLCPSTCNSAFLLCLFSPFASCDYRKNSQLTCLFKGGSGNHHEKKCQPVSPQVEVSILISCWPLFDWGTHFAFQLGKWSHSAWIITIQWNVW